MAEVSSNVLLTGSPGCGKTTVVRRVAERLEHLRLAGFYTQELREGGRRVGFEAVGLSGGRAPLAHVKSGSAKRVGRYGVELGEFDEIVREELERPPPEVDLYVIDEIGKMECYSETFVEQIRGLLDGERPVLATVAARGGGFISEVKDRDDVEILQVTKHNRDELPGELAARFDG